MKVLYHSHLDAGAYFSPTDAAVMSFGEPPAIEGGPDHDGPRPGVAARVPGHQRRPGGVDEHRLFVWDPTRPTSWSRLSRS